MHNLKSIGARAQVAGAGSHLSTSVYGQTIPAWYGRTRGPALLIYAGNLQTHKGATKKGTRAKGRLTSYSMAGDLLLGYGPMQGVGGIWEGKSYWSANSSSQTFTGTGPATTFNFTINNVPAGTTFVVVIGVTVQQAFNVNYNDYGGQPVSLSGNTNLPLRNQSFPAPNSGDWQYAGLPYAQYNQTYGSKAVTVVFPTSQSNINVTVYYLYTNNATFTPLSFRGLGFEQALGSGGSGQPITYPDFSGVSGQNIDLGIVNVMPTFSFEGLGLYGYGALGDCNPADVIADLICSGNRINGSVWNHGLSLNALIVPPVSGVNSFYTRYGGILGDEPNLWGPTYNGGSNLGLNAVRNYCQAYGIGISYRLDTQQHAAQILDELCAIANCAPVWDGATLQFIPYCEVSAYGNGASYVAPTASGPLFTLTDSDYLVKKEGESPVTLIRQRPQGNYNSCSIEFTDRMAQLVPGTNVGSYNSGHVVITDGLDVTVQGPMPGSTLTLKEIHDAATATNVGWAIMRRQLLISRRTYKFSLPADWFLLAPMDLLLLTETAFPYSPIPVRITKITENEDFSLDIEAEPFLYGASIPLPPGVTPPSSLGTPVGNQNVDPGAVNAPIIFEAVPAISNRPQIWFGLSGSNSNYGGCSIWLSTDGGVTYNVIGQLVGKNTMGVTYNSDFPVHADPDAADTCWVDLTESLGTMASFTTAQRDLFQSICYLAGGGTVVVNGQTLTIPYELIAYATATLQATNKYSLPPTLRRGVYGTPIADHPIGTAFSFLEDGVLFQLAIDPNWIGQTLYFKFTAFNIFGQNEQQLSAATAYTFAPTGQVGWSVSGGGNPGGNQPYPTGGQNPNNAMANDLYCFIPGTFAVNQVLFQATPTRNLTIPANLAGSNSGCLVAPTNAVTITIQKNGSSIGTVNFAASSTTPTFTFASAVSFNGTTDKISYVAPGTLDATFAGFWLDIWATRSN